MPARTKGVWQTLPPELREDIWAREIEFDTAFKRYDGLGPFAIEAAKNGTNLVSAFRSYVDLENRIRRDPLDAIHALGIMFRWDMRAFAYAVGVRYGIIEPPAPTPAPDPVEAVREEVTAQQIADFKNDPRNEFFDLVRPRMSELISSGDAKSLGEAYLRSCEESLHVQEILMARKRQQLPVNPYQRNSTAVQQSKAANKAIGGAPSTDVRPRPPSSSAGSTYDDVRLAVERQRRG
ncbi:MAG: hypothetical protein USCAAHI_01788 [Beijerinckiaceae bacterium]|nr:MAG: hypothetical protein USCAAHI_01788 [Beijerinckiaceae bacterium]